MVVVDDDTVERFEFRFCFFDDLNVREVLRGHIETTKELFAFVPGAGKL